MENQTLIAVKVGIVARNFLSLVHELSTHAQFAEQVMPIAVEDELSRFKVWAGNVAAHRRGRRSLEYRLRDSEKLKAEVHNSLNDLVETINESIAIVKGEKVPWEMERLDSDSDSDSGSSDTASDPEYDTELKQLLNSIRSCTTGLFRLSMAIRNPAPSSQIESAITIDKSVYKQHDISHVQEKFPHCARFLTERLGRANSARRQYLAYREEHHKKLTKDVEKIGLEDSKTEHSTNSTEATPIPEINHQNSFNVVAEDDAASQTSFATSVNTAIRIPALPEAAKTQDFFECPLCFMIISAHTKHSWKQHVYRDLHPYCCTFEDCVTATRLFDSRHEWFDHELAHRRLWECVEGCGQTFFNLSDFEDHVRNKHNDLSVLLPAMKSTSARGASLSTHTECPMCKNTMALKSFRKHVASHQQQLALFALPSNLDGTGDDEDENLSDTRAEIDEGDEDSAISDIDEPQNSNIEGSHKVLLDPEVTWLITDLEELLAKAQYSLTKAFTELDFTGYSEVYSLFEREFQRKIHLCDETIARFRGSPVSHRMHEVEEARDAMRFSLGALSLKLAAQKFSDNDGKGGATLNESPGTNRNEKQLDKLREQKLESDDQVDNSRFRVEEKQTRQGNDGNRALESHGTQKLDSGSDGNDLRTLQGRQTDDQEEYGHEQGHREEVGNKKDIPHFKGKTAETVAGISESQHMKGRKETLAEVSGPSRASIQTPTTAYNLFETEESKRIRHKYEEHLRKRRLEQEEELERTMRGRLSELGFQDNQIEALVQPENSKDLPQGHLPQPTYAKIHVRDLDVQTLHYYEIPYEYDPDPSYIILLRELSQREIGVLFEHTRRLRSNHNDRLFIEDEGRDRRFKKEDGFFRKNSMF